MKKQEKETKKCIVNKQMDCKGEKCNLCKDLDNFNDDLLDALTCYLAERK